MAAIILLLANTSAFSRKLSPPPYTVDSEIRWYLAEDMRADNIEDVLPSRTLLVTSYNQAGTEVVLSVSFPKQALKSVVGNIFLTFWGAANSFKRHFGQAVRIKEQVNT